MRRLSLAQLVFILSARGIQPLQTMNMGESPTPQFVQMHDIVPSLVGGVHLVPFSRLYLTPHPHPDPDCSSPSISVYRSPSIDLRLSISVVSCCLSYLLFLLLST